MNAVNRGLKSIVKQFIVYFSLFCFLSAQTAYAARDVTYFHTDGLGSVVAASDDNGELLWRKHYAPYGEQVDGDTDNEPLSYTGKQHDDTSGLTYFGARYYDPEVGRFMGRDPAGVLGHVSSNPMMFNRYAYANNNPYRYIDPDGNLTVPLVFGAILLVTLALTGVSANSTRPMQSPDSPSTGFLGHQGSDANSGGFEIPRFNLPTWVSSESNEVSSEERKAANDAFKNLPRDQRKAVQEFFGRGHEGLDNLEKNFQIPQGLTKDALEKYKNVAENQIKRGGDKNGVQERRLKAIDRAMKNMED